MFVATGNEDKLREIREILDGSGIAAKGIHDVDPYPEPDESGETLAENALIKAREGFLRTGLPSLADDSALEVEALGLAPGLYSSRFAGENVSYADNVRKLLRELRSVPEAQRAARFRCVMALVYRGHEVCWEGIAAGKITFGPQGENGFGYDSVFFSDELGRTFAEVPASEKNRVSHRGKALKVLTSELKAILSIQD